MRSLRDGGGGSYVAFLKRNESEEDTKGENVFGLEGLINKEGQRGECGGERERST